MKFKPLSIHRPDLAKLVHPAKNKDISTDKISVKYNKEVILLCEKGHEWIGKINNLARHKQVSCEVCSSFGYNYPELLKEWHKKNTIDPYKITSGSHKKAIWICQNQRDHEYEATIHNRVSRQSNCPYCSKNLVTYERSLAYTHPELSKQFHPIKNAPVKIDKISQHYRKDVLWICEKKHEWSEPVANRVQRKELNCKVCNSVGYLKPSLIKEWHSDNELSPYELSHSSNEKIHWLCQQCSNVWLATVANRFRGSGCPGCSSGWSVENIRRFVASLLSEIDNFTEVELYVLFQQTGLLEVDKESKGKSFIQALKTGKFPKEELEKFVNKIPSLVDEFLADQNKTLESSEDILTEISEQVIGIHEELNVIETKNVLSTIDSKIFANRDKEAVEFFIKSAVEKIWRHAYIDENNAIPQLTQYHGNGSYAQEVIKLFNQDYLGTKQLKIPTGYSSNLIPNLMQCHIAYLVKNRKRAGNWSGAGAGKTLSAILASRLINAYLTIICCPNNVIENWKLKIIEAFPDSIIYSKEADLLNISTNSSQYKYLILNYDFFQQPQAEHKLKNFINNQVIDFMVIDEIHYSKQREENKISQRKKVITSFLSEISQKNINLHVLAMSATPVINNLFEGKTMVELLTGIDHSDLKIKPTTSNCISLYQKFMLHGIRWVPKYNLKMHLFTPEVDCSSFIQEIKNISSSGRILDLEALLTKAKLTTILQNLQPKTVIYTHYRKGIENILLDSITQQGWRVGVFNGDTKEGLIDFMKEEIDILIASSCITTGIDGLQKICNRLIVNSLPWTHAEFEQLKGRIYRQGQIKNQVDIIVPLTFAIVKGERWSWCESRWRRIQFKKSIADAAVDGVIPEGHLRSPKQAYNDCMQWLDRLENGQMYEVERQTIFISLSDEQKQIGIRKVGKLSVMNQQINCDSSMQTHQRFSNNPNEWHNYQAVYRQTRQEWEVIPYQEAIKWCQSRPPNLIIGDFGCGEAMVAQQLPNTVYSFDHIAINQSVIACDMTKVTLENGSLDIAIFSLSLMGTNWIDYLKEANRCLKLDGHLWIAEPSSRFKNIDLFKKLLDYLGFDVRRIHEKWKFTFIETLKSERNINVIMLQDFISKEILD